MIRPFAAAVRYACPRFLEGKKDRRDPPGSFCLPLPEHPLRPRCLGPSEADPHLLSGVGSELQEGHLRSAQALCAAPSGASFRKALGSIEADVAGAAARAAVRRGPEAQPGEYPPAPGVGGEPDLPSDECREPSVSPRRGDPSGEAGEGVGALRVAPLRGRARLARAEAIVVLLYSDPAPEGGQGLHRHRLRASGRSPLST